MEPKTVSLAQAKARLSELTEHTAAGESVLITKHGKAVGRLTSPDKPRKPVDLAALQRVTAGMPRQPEDAGRFMRAVRDDARY